MQKAMLLFSLQPHPKAKVSLYRSSVSLATSTPLPTASTQSWPLGSLVPTPLTHCSRSQDFTLQGRPEPSSHTGETLKLTSQGVAQIAPSVCRGPSAPLEVRDPAVPHQHKKKAATRDLETSWGSGTHQVPSLRPVVTTGSHS